MYHFPSTHAPPSSSSSSSSNATPNTPNPSSSAAGSGLNATQTKQSSNPLFLRIEEELHDARRVREYGQEEDLRLALDMVIGRVNELSTTLSEAYKAQAELELQLNVAKSNLQLVIMNNEMLEEALKKNSGGGAARDVGWRRGGAYASSNSNPNLERSQSVDYPPDSPASAGTETRFFKFRFSGNSNRDSNASGSGRPSSSRPSTPIANNSNITRSPNPNAHLTSPSMPSLSHSSTSNATSTSTGASTYGSLEDELEQTKRSLEELAHTRRQLEEQLAHTKVKLEEELEKEKKARKKAQEEKSALEDEVEALSQALFEEANKMVAQERMKLAETEEELKETRAEKEALQRALRLLHGEQERMRVSSAPPGGSAMSGVVGSGLHTLISAGSGERDEEGRLRKSSSEFSLVSASGVDADVEGRSRSRSSSRVGVKSVPGSPRSSYGAGESESGERWYKPAPTSLSLEGGRAGDVDPVNNEGKREEDQDRDRDETEAESYPTPRYAPPSLQPEAPSSLGAGGSERVSMGMAFTDEPSPWADVPSAGHSRSGSLAGDVSASVSSVGAVVDGSSSSTLIVDGGKGMGGEAGGGGSGKVATPPPQVSSRDEVTLGGVYAAAYAGIR